MEEKRIWFLIKNQDGTWTLALAAHGHVLPLPTDLRIIITQDELRALADMLAQERSL